MNSNAPRRAFASILRQAQSPLWFVAGAAAVLVLTSCGRKTPSAAGSPVEITVWSHHGKPEEWNTIQAQVERFNASQMQVVAHLVEIAEADYDTQVQSAAASGKLPDVMELDGPMLANYAWKGYLKPLDGLPADLQSDLLPSIVQQGMYNGRLYAVGVFDSGLGLYVNRSRLEAVNARIPTGVDDAWTVAEFDQLLARLSAQEKSNGGDGAVLDLKREYRGEWWTYGFYPALVSAGADLIDRDGYESADGTLNSPAAVRALSEIQGWLRSDLVDPNTDDRAFIDGRVALSWDGHWDYPRYREALGDQLVLVPLPDFGQGSRTGLGSWAWSMTRRADHPDAALAFIEFLLKPEEIDAMVAANGAVPSRKSVVADSDLYGADGPLHLFAEQLGTSAISRPVTPAYPVITSAFQEAMAKIIDGGDVKAALDGAVNTIDQDIRDNDGYPAR